MRNSFQYHIAGLLVGALATVFAASASARTYSEKEIKCAVRAVYHELGSSMIKKDPVSEAVYQRELRLTIHSFKVRAETDNPFLINDWGGPDLCGVLAKKIGSTNRYQYSYRNQPHKDPIRNGSWDYLTNDLIRGVRTLVSPVIEVTNKTVETTKGTVREKIFEIDLWKRSQDAAYDVLRRGWTPEGELVRADTFWHKCLLEEFRPENGIGCGRLNLAKGQNLCWYLMDQVVIPGQSPILSQQYHVFSRGVTLDEARARIKEDPPKVCDGLNTVQIVHEGWQKWIAWEEAKALNPDLKPPVIKKRVEKKEKKKKHAKKAKKKKHSKR